MNAIMEKSFDQLEAALIQLVESISSYNPSPLAAQALVIADTNLSESLELLAEHQANHHKIQSLRATSEALDQRLTQLLSALAQTRKQLLAVPSTSLPQSRDVPYEELLTYARKISKYSRPGGVNPFHKPLPTVTTTVPDPTTSAATTITTDPSASSSSAQPRPELGLTEQEAQALDPSGRAFFPWPSEELMGRGGLATFNFAGEIALLSPEAAAAAQAPPEAQLNGGVGGEQAAQQQQQGDGDGAPQVNGHAGGEGSARQHVQRDLERERQSREAAHAAVFSGLHLYDPDED